MPIRITINPNSDSSAEWAIFHMAETLGPAWDVWMNRHLVFNSRACGAMNRLGCRDELNDVLRSSLLV